MSAHVLIVDDNRDLAENIGEILEAEGYTAEICVHPEEAIAKAKEHSFDVAILDIRLPGMDGVALHEHLVRLQPDATYVLMSAFTTDERMTQALASGVRAVFAKPVPVDELLALLPPAEEGAEVLLVDDDDGLRDVLGEALAHAGYAIRGVGTVTGARRELGSRRPAAAVVDLRLPDGNGIDFAVDCAAAGVPCVLISAFEAEEALATMREHGNSACKLLQKPFPAKSLLDALAALAGGSSPP